MKVLPEEANCESLRVTDDQRYPFLQNIFTQSGMVLQALLQCMQLVGQNTELQEDVFRR